MFAVSDEWKQAYPDAVVGVLAMRGVTNPENHPALAEKKKELESDLRTLFKDKEELRSIQPIVAYRKYYKRFKKSYHVLQQLESVVFKGRSIPSVAAIVEAMFMAELRNMLLTAGHDLDVVKAPATVDVARGDEKYVRINGEEQTLKTGDMMISDAEGVISSIIYGPDKRTRITSETTSVLFTTYGVPGVGEQQMRQHLEGIESHVRIVAPDAGTVLMEVFGAQ
jgi:DNA/RNA-binding domain of Phe-tRNA-synthetase-like protein